MVSQDDISEVISNSSYHRKKQIRDWITMNNLFFHKEQQQKIKDREKMEVTIDRD